MTSRLETPTATRNVAMGNLRAFVTLLVVLHHAILPYGTNAPPVATSLTAPPMWWGAFPIVDAHRFGLFDLIVGFNDSFFMPLMFFVSGLFFWPSLRRKTPGELARHRLVRLGIPFLISAAILAPLAYYPTFLQIRQTAPQNTGFVAQWLSLPGWPAGPAWFLWVLLAFDLIAAGTSQLLPTWGDRLGRIASRFPRPASFFLSMVALTTLAYLPMTRLIDPLQWVSEGPFWIQGSRALLYASWFTAGIALGAHGPDRGLLSREGKLARRWWAWMVATPIVFFIYLGIVISIFQALGQGKTPGTALLVTASFGFVVTCATAILAFLGTFIRFSKTGARFASLSANAYGMYLFHYALVSWLAFSLLPFALPGAIKGCTVFLGAAILSWAATGLLRRIPAIARVL